MCHFARLADATEGQWGEGKWEWGEAGWDLVDFYERILSELKDISTSPLIIVPLEAPVSITSVSFYNWRKPQCSLKVPVLFLFSQDSICSVAVCRHEVGVSLSPPFVTNFFVFSPFQIFFFTLINYWHSVSPEVLMTFEETDGQLKEAIMDQKWPISMKATWWW